MVSLLQWQCCIKGSKTRGLSSALINWNMEKMWCMVLSAPIRVWLWQLLTVGCGIQRPGTGAKSGDLRSLPKWAKSRTRKVWMKHQDALGNWSGPVQKKESGNRVLSSSSGADEVHDNGQMKMNTTLHYFRMKFPARCKTITIKLCYLTPSLPT